MLHLCLEEGGILIMTPEQRQSLLLKLYEVGRVVHKTQQEKDVVFQAPADQAQAPPSININIAVDPDGTIGVASPKGAAASPFFEEEVPKLSSSLNQNTWNRILLHLRGGQSALHAALTIPTFDVMDEADAQLAFKQQLIYSMDEPKLLPEREERQTAIHDLLRAVGRLYAKDEKGQEGEFSGNFVPEEVCSEHVEPPSSGTKEVLNIPPYILAKFS